MSNIKEAAYAAQFEEQLLEAVAVRAAELGRKELEMQADAAAHGDGAAYQRVIDQLNNDDELRTAVMRGML